MSDNYYFGAKNFKQSKEQTATYGDPIDLTGLPRFIRTKQTGDRVYLTGKDGRFHWIKNPEALKAAGGDFGMVVTIDQRIYPTGEPISADNAKDFVLDQGDVSSPALEDTSSNVEEKIVSSSGDEVGDIEVVVKKEYKVTEEGKRVLNEFKTYEYPEIDVSPKKEPIKGLTSIIIPAYFNTYPLFHMTGHCIGSIREHTNKETTPYEIILVINGNTGIGFKDPKESKADKVIQNEENEGFAKAVNKGIRCASGEYIAIINNDVLVFDHWLDDMQEALRFDLNLVMATPMYGKPFARAVEARELRSMTLNEVQVVPINSTFSDFKDFSCVLTRKKVFDQIGLFDEQFKMYAEDIDLMRRMDKAGLKYASTKRVNTFHVISMTASGIGETPDIMTESKEKLKQKYGY